MIFNNFISLSSTSLSSGNTEVHHLIPETSVNSHNHSALSYQNCISCPAFFLLAEILYSSKSPGGTFENMP